MKKKIKDLTKEEIKKVCKKHNFCLGCPLQLKGEGISSFCLSPIIPLKDKLEKMMERKVEIEDDKKGKEDE